jgi:RNA polymerase sigma-B factor
MVEGMTSVHEIDTASLFNRWQEDRDQSAREQLVEHFLPVARKLARRYQGAHEPMDDLIQVASLGLVKAIDRFDAERGVAFSTFAVPTILGELKRYFRDLGWSVHVPRGAQDRALKVADAQRRLTVDIGRSPTVQELAQYLELSIEDVLAGIEAGAAHHATSLDAPRDEDDGELSTLADSFGVEESGYERVELGATIGLAAERLTERERRVLALRYVEDLTQAEIAAEIGVSQMQVSRILRGSINELSDALVPTVS